VDAESHLALLKSRRNIHRIKSNEALSSEDWLL